MKVSVATRERFDPRDRPQTPWPLVQPLPIRVPNPTSRPPTTSNGVADVTLNSSGPRHPIVESCTEWQPENEGGTPTPFAGTGPQHPGEDSADARHPSQEQDQEPCGEADQQTTDESTDRCKAGHCIHLLRSCQQQRFDREFLSCLNRERHERVGRFRSHLWSEGID